MVYTDNDRVILQTRIDAIHEWINIFRNDKANVAVAAVEQVLAVDIPEIRRIRWFSVASKNELSTIWYRYLENEDLTGEQREATFDFYAMGVQYMEMMAPIASGHLEGFQMHLARAITWPERSDVISDVVKANISPYSNVLTMIKENPWVTLFIILGMMDVKV